MVKLQHEISGEYLIITIDEFNRNKEYLEFEGYYFVDMA